VGPLTVSAAPVLAESVHLLRATADAVPPGGRKRQRDRAGREHAYIAFQRAAHAAAVWPPWLTILDQDIVSGQITTAQAITEMSPLRQVTVDLLAALSEIRIAGNPKPRQLAEEITTLLVELMDARIPARPVNGLRLKIAEHIYEKTDMSSALSGVGQRFRRLSGRVEDTLSLLDEGRRRAEDRRFADCQLALGTWHKRFTLAARKDLGYGPRIWHVAKKPRVHSWQIWRPHEEWPGGWPSPAASDLVSQAREERQARALGPSDGIAE